MKNQSQKSKQAKKLSDSRAEVLLLKEQVSEIKNNHLVHLAADIKNVDGKVDKLDIKVDSIQEHVVWVKGIFPEWQKTVNKIDDRTWWILATIIIGFLVSIYFK